MANLVVLAPKDASGEIRSALADAAIEAVDARDADDARERAARGELVLVDVERDADAAAALRELHLSGAVVAIDGARPTRDRVALLHAGALDVLVRPLRRADVERAITRAGHPALLGASEALGAVVEKIEACARDAAPVLLRGEPATGAESFARLVHLGGERARGPFVVVREPSGDAIADAMSAAKGGTLFVDRAHAIASHPAAQTLLRAHRDAKCDVRVVLAAHAPSALDDELAARTVLLPALRDRLEDVPAIARHFAGHDLAAKTVSALQSHRWPGNLDELERMISGLASADPGDVRVSGEFRVPVRREPVVLTLGDGAKRGGAIFRQSSDAIESLFESDDPFVPIDEAGTVRFYARRAIACLTITHDGVDASDPLVLRARIAVRLRCGARVEGELRYAAPRERARAIDHLNKPGRSFAVHDGALVHHVAKDHVEHVEEIR